MRRPAHYLSVSPASSPALQFSSPPAAGRTLTPLSLDGAADKGGGGIPKDEKAQSEKGGGRCKGTVQGKKAAEERTTEDVGGAR